MEIEKQVFYCEEVDALFHNEVFGKFYTTFCGVSTDTRKIVPEMIFVALVGEKFDGHNFILEAVKRGATGIVVDKSYSLSEDILSKVRVWKVDNTLKAYQAIGKLWREKFAIPIVAITGSNGKTTTKDLTAAILSGKTKVLKTEANYNNEIGLPLTLLNLKSEHGVAVVEMGMRGLGQIAELVAIAKPDIGVVTNVGETHMELLGSLENIAQAKGELVEGISENGVAVLNGDDPLVRQMAYRTKAEIFTFGINDNNTVYAKEIKFLPEGYTEFLACTPLGKIQLRVATLGMHNIYNTLAGITVAVSLGYTLGEIKAGLETYRPTKMRFETIEYNGVYLINDAYNASPMSTKAALENLNLVAKGRKFLVMGDMFELGNVAQTAHENIGKLAASIGVDGLYTRGELTKYTIKCAAEAGINTKSFASHEELAEFLIKKLEPGDTVLFKGSHGMHMYEIIDLIKDMWR